MRGTIQNLQALTGLSGNNNNLWTYCVQLNMRMNSCALLYKKQIKDNTLKNNNNNNKNIYACKYELNIKLLTKYTVLKM